jgi:hypothetical protein
MVRAESRFVTGGRRILMPLLPPYRKAWAQTGTITVNNRCPLGWFSTGIQSIIGAPTRWIILTCLAVAIASESLQAHLMVGPTNTVPSAQSTFFKSLGSWRDPGTWLCVGIFLAGLSSCASMLLGVSMLRRVCRMERESGTKIQADLRNLDLVWANRMEEATSQILRSIRQLQGCVECISGSSQQMPVGQPSSRTAHPRLDSPNPVSDLPGLGVSLKEEMEFLHWLHTNAQSHADIQTVPGRGGPESGLVHRIRASRIPLPWIQADLASAVVRLSRLNRALRDASNPAESLRSLVTTSQSRIPLEQLDEGIPSPWIIEVDVELLSRILRNPNRGEKQIETP